MSSRLKIWRESASLIIAAKSNFSQTNLHNYKLLCLQRSKTSMFMPNLYVFPGGNVSKSDSSIQWLQIFEKFGCKLDSLQELYPKENVPSILQNTEDSSLPKHLSLRICAIRETFEECGILICRNSKTNYKHNISQWSSYIGGHEILKWQHKIHADSNEFLNLCSQLEIYPDVWSLQNWSNWMTPLAIPTKFNTMFFFSAFSQMPDVHKDDKEVQSIRWATPDEYILQNASMLPTPQFYEISRIRNFSDIQTLSKYAIDRSTYGCATYFPYKVVTKDGTYYLFPGDEIYPTFVDTKDFNVPIIDNIPSCQVENRLVLSDNGSRKLIVKNLTSKDKHLPPVNYSV